MTTKIRQQNGITILEPNGNLLLIGSPSVSALRHPNCSALSPELELYFPVFHHPEAPSRILINFENVNKIDSTGLGALMGIRAITARKKGRVGVVNVSKQIKNLIVLRSRLVPLESLRKHRIRHRGFFWFSFSSFRTLRLKSKIP